MDAEAAASIKKEEVDLKPEILVVKKEEEGAAGPSEPVKTEGDDGSDKAGPSAPAAAVDMDDLLKVGRRWPCNTVPCSSLRCVPVSV